MRRALLAAAAALLCACGPQLHVVTDPGIRAAPEDEALVARGAYLFHGPAACALCHTSEATGVTLRGGDRPAPIGGRAWRMGPLGTMHAPNLTSDVATGLGGWSDQALARLLQRAVRPDGTVSPMMALSLGSFADDDVRALVSYLRTLPPVANGIPQQELTVLGRFVFGDVPPRSSAGAVAPELAPTIERGRYLANGPGACLGCHSERVDHVVAPGTELGGATAPTPGFVRGEGLVYLAPNLTSDPSGITGQWTEAQWVARFSAGRVFPGSPMGWGNHQELHEDDVRALWRYLRSVPKLARPPAPTVQPK